MIEESKKVCSLEIVVTDKKGSQQVEENWPYFTDHGYIKGPDGQEIEAYLNFGEKCHCYGDTICHVVTVIDEASENEGAESEALEMEGAVTRPVVCIGFEDSMQVLAVLAGQFEYDDVLKVTQMSLYELQMHAMPPAVPLPSLDNPLVPAVVG